MNHSLDIQFEDEHLLVVNKATGVLSQPGKTVDGSIATQVRKTYPDATGPLLVHRLDMDTSGLILLAKSRQVHRHLQQQFEHRTIGKRYVAIVSKPIVALGGCICLPLRLDINNRPVQIVCNELGKSATTLWHRTIENSRSPTAPQHSLELKNTSSSSGQRISFIPISGRTHQLRLHAAHRFGLNAPIVGDRLYGMAGERLMLHAEILSFTHPQSDKRITVKCAAPF